MQVFFMRNIRFYLIIGFIFTSALGTLSHFFYDWSDQNLLIGLISPSSPSLRPALLLGGLSGTFLIPVLFYTYSGILGHNITWIDITIFFISVFSAFFYAWRLQDSARIYQKRTAIYFLTVLFLILFILFTFLPPDIGLFAEP